MKLFDWVDRYHWLWLLVAAPFIFAAKPVYTPAMLVVPLTWLLHGFVEKRSYDGDAGTFLPVTPLNGPLLVMTIMVLVSLWATFDIAFSLEKIHSWVLGMGFFYATVRLGRNPKRWLWSWMAFLGGGFLFSLIGLFSTNWQHRFRFLEPVLSLLPEGLAYLPRAESGIHHNALGGTLLWILPMYLVLAGIIFVRKDFYSFRWLKGKGWWIRNFIHRSHLRNFIKWVLWVVTFFIGIVFLLSQSRGSYLALVLTIWGMLFLVSNKVWRWILGVSLISFLLVGIGLIYYIGWGQMVSSLGLTGQSGFSINTLTGRLEIWSRALQGIRDFPLSGMGMGTFREIVHIVYPIFQVSTESGLVMQAHNEYLQVALDLGIPGLIGFLSLYFIAFWMLVEIWEKSGSAINLTAKQVKYSGQGEGSFKSEGALFVRSCALGLGGGLLAHFLFGLTDAIILRAPGIFWWMLLGLITGLHQLIVRGESMDYANEND